MSELQPRVKEYQCLGVSLMSDNKMEREMDRWIGLVSAVMWVFYQIVVREGGS